MPVPLVVPDASVLLKWALESEDEEDRAQALALKEWWLSGAGQFAVPTLWVYEVGNILGIKRPSAARELLQVMVDLELEEKLNRSLAELNLSVRATNCLESEGINTVRDLVRRVPDELLTVRNFGETTLVEVEERLGSLGLRLGMKVPEASPMA